MAVTSIWAVTSNVAGTVEYVVNPEKTTERPELSPEAIAARKAVGDVIDYAVDADKTEKMMFVTGINCTPEHAAEEFMETKYYWGKTEGRLAYHGYQSFLEGEGEITAEKAHEIGVKLAQELWGDRFEVVVATHLNTGHYHNHLLVNSVSFMDGYKYRRTKRDYWQMRQVSDRLCREAKLHIVENSSIMRGKSYEEWSAERQGKPTVRGTIRDDIDYAIKLSRSEKDFARILMELGYEFKFFKQDGSLLEHPGLKPPGAKGYFRFRGLGPNYDYDSIRRRIIENTLSPRTPFLIETKSPSFGTGPSNESSLSSKYRKYCIRLYAVVSKPKNARREYIPMALREDIIKLDRYIEQMDFLYQHKIEDKQSLQSKRNNLLTELNALIIRRKKLYSAKKRGARHNDAAMIAQAKNEIRDVSKKIRIIEKQIRLCDAVVVSADRVVAGADAPTSPEIKSDRPDIRSQDVRKKATPGRSGI